MVHLKDEDYRQLIWLLVDVPQLQTEQGCRKVLELAGLRERISMITLSGNTFTFVSEIVGNLSSYGRMSNGQEALGLFLSTLKSFTGKEQQAVLDGLLTKYRMMPILISSNGVQQQKILILTAIPGELRLDREVREIEEAIRRGARRERFEIRSRTAVRPRDIRLAIAEERPQIVHFCGHGKEDGSLKLEDDAGNIKPVPPEGLAALFELHADYVNCVLLNACHSVKPTEAISQYINYVIGMNQKINDKAALVFAQGFYDGLGFETPDHQDVFQRAFDEGLLAIKLEHPSEGQIPILKKKFRTAKDSQ